MPWRRVIHEYLVRVISTNPLFKEFVHRTQSGISNSATRLANNEPIWKPDKDSELKDGFVNLYRRKR
eukprot:jgi/Hompol1/7094/HPOL_000740-RA